MSKIRPTTLKAWRRLFLGLQVIDKSNFTVPRLVISIMFYSHCSSPGKHVGDSALIFSLAQSDLAGNKRQMYFPTALPPF